MGDSVGKAVALFLGSGSGEDNSRDEKGREDPVDANVADDFETNDMVMLTRSPAPDDRRPPLPSEAAINAIMDEFDFDPTVGSAVFAAELYMHGRTLPNDDPEIGPPAFAERIATGLGPTVDLRGSMVALSVACTIAHELTHAQQFEVYAYIKVPDGHQFAVGQEDITQLAYRKQTAVFEGLAYQSEVRNLNDYKNAHANAFADVTLLGEWQALMDQAVSRRDEELEPLSGDEKQKLLDFEIDDLLALIQSDVDPALIVNRH